MHHGDTLAGSSGGRCAAGQVDALIRSLFIGRSAPEECLFVCVHDGGDKKLMRMRLRSGGLVAAAPCRPFTFSVGVHIFGI